MSQEKKKKTKKTEQQETDTINGLMFRKLKSI